jgi:Kef-type K+ transport system membrane component KefB/nucleotide-binding universal stress UspA family protein
MDEVMKPLSSHAVLLVLLQMSAIITIARIGSELVRRVGLPSVIGELAAGILLGPTIFGHYLPGAFHELFPRQAAQFHLLEIVSWIGMILLMLLTGIETDVRLLRNLGRSAFTASIFGMVVPFGAGLALGWEMPKAYVANPAHQTIFALFLATAMAISAMPVIAKILLDLDLTRRNMGVVILSAGVVDDTTGWIILSVIAGAAGGTGANVRGLAIALGGTAAFLIFARVLLFPLLKVGFKVANDRARTKDSDIVLMMVTTLLCACATDIIGIHAVFGAFVAGCVIRQVPHLKEESLHKLESVTFSVFAPLFFGLVGLKVDLWLLGDFWMLLVVLGVATAGKLVGCTLGSLLGGLGFWESLSIAVAMNARGAMELVVATIGLSLGILNQQMYSIVVMVAVTTSFLAPLLLRLTMRMVRMTADEAERMLAEASKGMFDAEKLRVLVPTAGGPNALVAAKMGMSIAHRSAHAVTVLFVQRSAGIVDRIRGVFRKSLEGQNIQAHLDEVKQAATRGGYGAPQIRRETSRDVPAAIQAEATHGYDLILTGASGEKKRGVRGQKLESLVSGAPCHVAIVKHRGKGSGPFQRLLVPVDGSFLSKVAMEFAVRYAEGAGSAAEVTFAILTEKDLGDPRGSRPGSSDSLSGVESVPTMRVKAQSILLGIDDLAKEGGLDKLSPIFKATKVKTHLITTDGGAGGSILGHASSGVYDLLVLGAEHRAIHNRLFFGYEKERLLENSSISVVLLVPKVR